MGLDPVGKMPVRDRAGDIFGMTDRANAGGAHILQQYPPRGAVYVPLAALITSSSNTLMLSGEGL